MILFLFVLFYFNLNVFSNAIYSTKTAYNETFSKEQLKYLKNFKNYKITNCITEQIYILSRHGSRYPSNKQVQDSIKFLHQIEDYYERNGELNGELSKIKVNFKNESDSRLSGLGADEMRSIGKRYRKRFPEIFDFHKVLTPLKSAKEFIHIISSSKERSIQSAINYIKGIYDFNNSENFKNIIDYLSDNIEINDRLMRMYSECGNYLSSIKNNQSAFNELLQFKYGKEITNLLFNLKQRNLIPDFDLTPETAHGMPLNWCRTFAKEDYEILSYLNDLKTYWLKSYGNQINSKMALLIIQDLFKEIDSYINNNSKRKIILRFGHAENIIPVLTALGLFKDDEDLNADNYEQLRERKFRGGFLAPFGSNIAFVLKKCSNQNDQNSYKIFVLVNELPVNKLTNAGKLKCDHENKSICDYFEFKESLKDYIDSNFEEICVKNRNEMFCEKNDLTNCHGEL